MACISSPVPVPRSISPVPLLSLSMSNFLVDFFFIASNSTSLFFNPANLASSFAMPAIIEASPSVPCCFANSFISISDCLTASICCLTPFDEFISLGSSIELTKLIIVCVACGTISITSLKKSSKAGASVALIAVVAFPIDDVISVKVFDTSRNASACVPVICKDLFTSSKRFLSSFNSLELPLNNGINLDASLPNDSNTNVILSPDTLASSILETILPSIS